jgi:hypothetical protein
MGTNVFALSRAKLLPRAPRIGSPMGKLHMRLTVTASLHPTAWSFNADLFNGAVLLLRNSGIPVSISLISHFLQLFYPKNGQNGVKNMISFLISTSGIGQTTTTILHNTLSLSWNTCDIL